jgi:uncharacterized protein (UPF0147 family)
MLEIATDTAPRLIQRVERLLKTIRHHAEDAAAIHDLSTEEGLETLRDEVDDLKTHAATVIDILDELWDRSRKAKRAATLTERNARGHHVVPTKGGR